MKRKVYSQRRERHQQLIALKSNGADPQDPDEYCADNIFRLPKRPAVSFRWWRRC
ncbi:MAG: hypothetical protein M3541_13240 [Acidobacteriota bacterium]|nr:hypothetical protein [Acidobacteriota bacterium]